MAKQEIRDTLNLAVCYFENKHGKKVDINELIADHDFDDYCSLNGYFYVKNDVDYVDIQTLEKFELSLTLNLL